MISLPEITNYGQFITTSFQLFMLHGAFRANIKKLAY